MKLDLNIKEWVALYGMLERHPLHNDKHLTEVHNRMKATLVSILQEAEKDQFERWAAQTQKKIDDLKQQQPQALNEVATLTDDDDDVPALTTYPSRRRHPGPIVGKSGRRNR